MLLIESDQYSIEDSNIALLNGEVNSEMSEYFIKFMIEKNLKDDDKPKPTHLKVIINSCGGFIYDAFAIIDIMNSFSIPVHTYGTGIIASCGLLIFMSGEKGNRFLLKNTSILSHQFSGFREGKEHELKATEKEDKLVSKRMQKMYENATGMSKEDIFKILLPPEDVWLSPQEARRYGLCDKIIDKI